MFSIGLGLISTFNLSGIKNQSIIKRIRNNLKTVRNSYIIYFFLSTLCFIADNYLRSNRNSIMHFTISNIHFDINWAVLFCLYMFFSILYFIVNFFEIQKLNDDIFDNIK